MKEKISKELADLSGKALLREPRVLSSFGAKVEMRGREYLNFSSNDYLNLSKHPLVIDASRKAMEKYGSASGSARLLSGTLELHEELEHELADFLGSEAAVLFSSGYLANLGMLSTFVSRSDTIFADKLIHASLIDGCILSRAKHRRYAHGDLEELEELLQKEKREGEFFILTDSLFSMDGDTADIDGLRSLTSKYNAHLIVDEAHALGVMGEGARGLSFVGPSYPLSARESVREQAKNKEKPFLRSGTFSKAFASYGGFVACSRDAKKLLYSKARSFIFNTSLPPAVVAASLASLKLVKEDPHPGKRLLAHAKYFVDELSWRGVEVMSSESQIVPVYVGDSQKALELSEKLLERGILVPAIRPPTVKEARLRFSITLGHSLDDLNKVVEVLEEMRL